MAEIHICTNESLLAGALELEYQCPVCMFTAKHTVGYVGSRCHKCNQYYENEGWRGYAVYLRRIALGLKRKEFAEMIGIKRKTLANCETSSCSLRVYEKSLEIFRANFMGFNHG